MASAAVISLMQTINHFQNSLHFFSIDQKSCPEIIKSAYEEVISLKVVLLLLDDNISIGRVYSIAKSVNALEALESHLSNTFPSEYQIIQFPGRHLNPLQKFLQENIIGKKVNVLDGQLIKEALCKLENIVKLLASKFKKTLVFSVDMEEDINSFVETVTNINEYGEEDLQDLSDLLPEEDEEVDDFSYFFLKLDNQLTGFLIIADEVFEEILQRLNRSRGSSRSERLNALDGQIREAACKLEDALETHLSSQFLLQFDKSNPSLIFLDMQEVNQDIDSFIHLVNKLKEDYFNEMFNPLPDDDDDDNVISSRMDSGGKESKMVGFSDEFREIRNQLTGWTSKLRILSLYGMAGIGKTTLARNLFDDPLISSWFDRRVWVSIGPKYQLKEILCCILAQVMRPNIDKILMEGDENYIAQYLYQSLKNGKYLIVLDDVWDKQFVDNLERLLPDNDDGSRVLVTTRQGRVTGWYQHKMRFLNKEESWDLLRDKVFGEKSYPQQLEKAGKKIAESCEGLPLTIVTVADLLSNAKRTPEFWDKVAHNQNSVFMDAYDQITKVLLPSFNYLPQHLKTCFLYMGVFPQNYEIIRSELIKLWSAEGFLDRRATLTNLDTIIDNLVDNSLLIPQQKSSTFSIKTCSLHSSFWHLCKREAWKNKFSHVISSYADGLAEGIKSQRRLCIHNNIVFAIKDVYESMTSISTVLSLLCSGPPHLYPVPVCFGLKLLRVLDALSIRFYEFPMEVLKLVQLRYFAFSFNGKLPPSISKLWNLQFLIVRRHLSIKPSRARSYLPMEIWDMKELKHLQIMGSDIRDPCGPPVKNLVTLLDVSAYSCSEGILEKLPNLEKLGIRIELATDVVESFRCFDHISHLHRLKSLKCVIVNPILIRPEVIAAPPPLSILPSGLRKLTLSGLGYPWEDMNKIVSLPKLEVLKLRCYAFRGPKWETRNFGFSALKFLQIEDSDLVHWTVTRGSFMWLRHLSLKNCYKLEEIPREFHETLHEIEVVDCNPIAVICAKQIKEDRLKIPHCTLDVHVRSSWDDGKLNS